MTIDPVLIKMIAGDTRGWTSVVDYGCGDGKLLDALWHIPDRYGVDIVPQLEHDPTWVFIEGDIRAAATVGTQGALLVDVIEHLERSDGEHLLEQLRAKHDEIIVFTPNGFWSQNELPGNPYQKHLSGWTTEDFTPWCCECIELDLVGAANQSIYARWDRAAPSLSDQWKALAGS